MFSQAAENTSEEQQAINLYLLTQSDIKSGEYQKAEQVLNRMKSLPSAMAYTSLAINQFAVSKTIPELNSTMLLSKSPSVKTSKVESTKTEVVKPEEKKPYSLSLNAVIGSDSNPVFVPDNSDAKVSARSTFFSTTAAGSFQTKFYDGDMINGLAMGYTSFQKEEAKVFNNLRLNLSTNWKPAQSLFKENSISFLNKLDRSYMTNKALKYYFTGDTLSLNKDFMAIGEHRFNASLFVGYRTYGNQDLTAVENDRTGGSVGLRGIHKIGRGDWAWLNSMTYANQSTVGKKFNTKNLELVTSFQKVTFYDVEALLSASYSIVNYPKFTQSRTDKSVGIGLDLSHELPWKKGLNSKISYIKNKNNSPVSESTYTQDVFSLWVVYDVFKKFNSTISFLTISSLASNQVLAQLNNFRTKDLKPLSSNQAKLKKFSTQKIGKILSISGVVKLDSRSIVVVGQDLYVGSTIETQGGFVSVLVGDNHLIELDSNSRFRIVPLGDIKIAKGVVDVAGVLDHGKLKAIKTPQSMENSNARFPIITEGGTLILDSGRYLIEAPGKGMLQQKVKFLSLDSNPRCLEC
jgi:hypothetical protein